TAEDLARFVSFQFSEGAVGGKQVLSYSTLKEMHAPVFVLPDWSGGLAIGWSIGPVANYTTVRFEGSNAGYQARIQFVPALKIGVVILMNRFIGNDGLWPLVYSALEHLIPAVKNSLDSGI
ncbi:MAG: serine hydrolase domain-containing protein, partial [Candidatus Thorarchaeota archaeon]